MRIFIERIKRSTIVLLSMGVVWPVAARTPDDTLVMAWNIDAISTFDPAQIGEVVTNELITNTCDTLVSLDPADATRILPGLAERWEFAPDGSSVTFTLREGASFPSGNPVTAADAAWSIQRVLHLGFGNAATLTEYGFTAEGAKTQITAPDDRTLVLQLDRPYPEALFLQAIAANRVAITVDRQLLEANQSDGDYGNEYLLTRTECFGPYRLVQWNAGEGVILEANEGYAGEAPALRRVFVRHVAEPGTQRLMLEQGEVDVARDLGSEDLAALESGGVVAVDRVLRQRVQYWTFNAAGVEPFIDPRVRLAMRYLVDYDGLGSTVLRYTHVPRQAFAPLGAFGALNEEEGRPFSLDIERARALLSDAGYGDGFSFSIIIGNVPAVGAIAESIQQNAAQVGVRVSIERMAAAQLFSRTRSREYESAILAWETNVADAHGMASRIVFSPSPDAQAQATMFPSWIAGYYDADVNERIQTALVEPDASARAAIYEDLQRQILQEGPMAILFQGYNVAGVRPELSNWSWNAFRTYYGLASK